jgi:amidase
MVPAAHGGDGGGSIRIPSSCCGLFGLKPSRGRNPDTLPYKVWLDGVVEHVLTRSVRDSAAFLDATALTAEASGLPQPEGSFLDEVGQAPGRLRIGLVREPLLQSAFDADCLAGLESTAELCRELGHEIVEATPAVDKKRFAGGFARMLCAEVNAEIQQAQTVVARKVHRDEFEAATWAFGLLGQTISAADLVQAHRDIQQIAAAFIQWTAAYDVVLTPTLAKLPLTVGELQPKGSDAMALRVFGRLGAGRALLKLGMLGTLADEAFDFIPTTPLFNMSGQPAMSLPLHWSDAGLPVGMHFSAQAGEEGLLLRLAGQLEAARPWAGRRPAI